MTRAQLVVLSVVAAVLLGGLVLAFVGRDHDAQPMGVWSEEHGHYH